jgi:hypothetical protein
VAQHEAAIFDIANLLTFFLPRSRDLTSGVHSTHPISGARRTTAALFDGGRKGRRRRLNDLGDLASLTPQLA